MKRGRVPGLMVPCLVGLLPTSGAAQPAPQGRGNPNPLRMLTKTVYTPRTEFFAVYRPYVVGQEGPKAAVVRIDGQPHVYVRRRPEAYFLRLIKTGDGNDRYVAVTDGIREGDRIVTVGMEKMPRK